MVYLVLDSHLMSEQVFYGFPVCYKMYFMLYLVLDSDLLSEQVFYGLPWFSVLSNVRTSIFSFALCYDFCLMSEQVFYGLTLC